MISAEQQQTLGDVDLAIFDVDQTLVFPDNPSFYTQYGDAVTQTIAARYDIEPDRAQEIAAFYRKEYGGGEQALFRGNIQEHFPDMPALAGDVTLLYDNLTIIDPVGRFPSQPDLREGLASLRSLGVSVVALTSSPDQLSQAILKEAGYKPDEDFDMFVAYDRVTGPPKMVNTERVFDHIAHQFDVPPSHALAVGDSFAHDIAPAAALGMRTCWLSQKEAPEGYAGMVVEQPIEIIAALQNAIANRSNA
jgi:FMN phosphatase YigB (HAD superfamily)